MQAYYVAGIPFSGNFLSHENVGVKGYSYSRRGKIIRVSPYTRKIIRGGATMQTDGGGTAKRQIRMTGESHRIKSNKGSGDFNDGMYGFSKYLENYHYNGKPEDPANIGNYKGLPASGFESLGPSSKKSNTAPKVSDEYKEELEFNSRKNKYFEDSSDLVTKPKKASAPVDLSKVSDEYKEELEFNSRKNVWPEQTQIDSSVNNIAQNIDKSADTVAKKNEGLISKAKQFLSGLFGAIGEKVGEIAKSIVDYGKTYIDKVRLIYSFGYHKGKGDFYPSTSLYLKNGNTIVNAKYTLPYQVGYGVGKISKKLGRK